MSSSSGSIATHLQQFATYPNCRLPFLNAGSFRRLTASAFSTETMTRLLQRSCSCCWACKRFKQKLYYDEANSTSRGVPLSSLSKVNTVAARVLVGAAAAFEVAVAVVVAVSGISIATVVLRLALVTVVIVAVAAAAIELVVVVAVGGVVKA